MFSRHCVDALCITCVYISHVRAQLGVFLTELGDNIGKDKKRIFVSKDHGESWLPLHIFVDVSVLPPAGHTGLLTRTTSLRPSSTCRSESLSLYHD